MQHLTAVLQKLKDAGLSLKLKTYFFLQERVDYLCHFISPGKLQITDKACVAIKGQVPAKSFTEMRDFLGFCNVYRRYVENCARIVHLLTERLKGRYDENFSYLDADELAAFKTLKEKLTSDQVLTIPKPGLKYVVDTDACDKQLGCVLMQERPYDDGKIVRRPVGYFSRALTAPECNYCTTKRECLGIVWVVLLLQPYLQGENLILRTDHTSLKTIMTDGKQRDN